MAFFRLYALDGSLVAGKRGGALSTGFAVLAPLRPWAGQSHAGVPEIDFPAQGLSGGSGVFWGLLECGFGVRFMRRAGLGSACSSRYDFCYGIALPM